MSDSIREALQLHLQEKQYHDIIVQYHFEEENLAWLMQMGAQAERVAEPVMYYSIPAQEERVSVIVSLGSGIDELQERYMLRESLTESYMIECISMELLRTAYEQAAERIYARTGMWVSDFDFPGEKMPLQSMEEIFRRLRPEGIAYNHAYMLIPKKTVAFFTDLCARRQDSHCRICAGCGNLSCQNRRRDGADSQEGAAGSADASEKATEILAGSTDAPESFGDALGMTETSRSRKLTYGYQRIFGREN